jgi:hypothetical protein
MGTPAKEEAAARALDLGLDFNRTLIGLWLHGSAKVARAAHELDIEMNKLFVTARTQQFNWGDRRTRRASTERALERFTETVRSELGLPAIAVEVHIDDLVLHPSTAGSELSADG